MLYKYFYSNLILIYNKGLNRAYTKINNCLYKCRYLSHSTVAVSNDQQHTPVGCGGRTVYVSRNGNRIFQSFFVSEGSTNAVSMCH